MADYRLTQSGDEVQNILNNATPQSDLTAETERAQVAEQALQGNIDIEERDRKAADVTLQENIDTEQQARINDVDAEETRAKARENQIAGALSDEETRAKAAEKANADDIDAIEEKIPEAASSSNQLADKAFVNSSISTASATFRGTYNLVSDMHLTVSATRLQIAAALPNVIATADNNDYCFVQIPTADATPTEIARIERYKFDGSAWAFEYELNNSGFTAAQWAALNSGITSGLVTKLSNLPTNAELTTLLAGKQAVIDDLDAIRTGAGKGDTAYQKPVSGIPSSDMSAAVQTSLSKADAAAPQSTTYNKTEVDGLVDDEETRAKAAETALGNRVSTIEGKIPAAATDQNQLADKNYVNNAITTNTAEFKGSYNEVTDLLLTTSATRADIAAALAANISGADNNDYAYVQIPTGDATPTVIASVERYKYNGSAWAFEYVLNNSGFNSAQWEAINSMITSGLVAKLSALPTNSELTTLLAGKQAVISDLQTIREGAADGATAYQKPVGGIPGSDMTSGVQTSLGKADTAYQLPSGGIPKTDLSDSVQTSLGKADTALQEHQSLSNYYTKSETDGVVATEETRAKAAEKANADDIDAIEIKIPAAASDQNQLADKAFVNNSIATATATFRGSFNLVSDLSLTISATHTQIGTALGGEISGADNNDYAFIQIPTADDTPTVIAKVERYKFDGTDWSYEYDLNNSGFTQAQWDALNSAITSGLVAKLSALPTNSELTTLLAGKQAVISDLQTIREGAAAGATAYQKPQTGIPDTDLSSGVQTSLGKANSAYQVPSGGIPANDMAAGVQSSLTKANDAAPQATTYTKTEVDAMIANFITNTVNNLVNYYLKSETYNKNEVDAMVAAIQQFRLVSVAQLPTASADTMNKIYLVPSANPQTQNTKDEFITLMVDEQGTVTYSWECIGSTEVNLTNYYTKSQTDAAITAAINTALANYSTTSQVGTIVSTAITTALANYYTKTQVDNELVKKTDKLTMTGEGAAMEDDIMVIDENGNIKDGGKKISDLQLKVTDCAMLGGGFPTCTTAGGTAAKTVTISNFLLLTNCRISVLFQNAFTASNPTLSINGGTAIAIKHFGRAMEIGKVHANTILTMVYDGTYWQVIGIESMTGSTPSGAVDLALPSGLLWCEHNIGAASPYDHGLYFSWGNVTGHAEGSCYDFSQTVYDATDGAALTGNIAVGNEYDMARHNMGAPWRLPTKEEFKELNDNCTSLWTDEDGVAGRRFTSNINGNSVFFPASGLYDGTTLNNRGSRGYYWSSSYDSATNACYMGFNSSGVSPQNDNRRRFGFSVRAVQ